MSLRVEFTTEATADVRKLEPTMRRRVFGKLQWLAGNFVAVTPAPLGGSLAGFYKLRVGSYRVIYTIDEKREVLVVHMVGHRSQIYHQRK